MNKLLIMMVSMAICSLANAATCTWTSDDSGLVYPGGGVSGGEGYVTMYLWTIDETSFNTLHSAGDSGVSSAVWTTYGSNLAGAESHLVDSEGQICIASGTSYAKNETAYAAVIFTYDEGSGVTYYKGNIGSYTFDSDSDMTVSQMDSMVLGSIVGTTALTWTATPEPTSGLLLLLGMAGLALKRKRA